MDPYKKRIFNPSLNQSKSLAPNATVELTPESDQQELWEQNGRIKALKAYARLRDEMSTTDIIAMLGGEVDGE